MGGKGAGLLMPKQRAEVKFWAEFLPLYLKWLITEQGHRCRPSALHGPLAGQEE